MSNMLIEALKRAQRHIEQEIQYIETEPVKVWRERPEDWHDNKAEAKEALRKITDQIIEAEIAERDPIQYAEQYAEISAACAMNGNRDDPSLYLLTPEQERLFQEQIRHDVEHGYWDSDGQYEPGLYEGMPQKGGCPTCGTELWDDECYFAFGTAVCESCNEDIVAWHLLCWNLFPRNVDKYELSLDRWGTYSEWNIDEKEMAE